MSAAAAEDEPRKLRDDPDLRERLRERLNRYLDLPLALASILLVLITLIQLSGELAEPWDGRLEVLGWVLWGLFLVEFVAKFTLAPNKRAYLRRNWLDVLVVLLPFLRVLRLLRIMRAARALPLLRLLIFGGRGTGAALDLLKRRRLGQLAIVSVLVILIGAAVAFILEADAPDSQIEDFGEALWWAATLGTAGEIPAEPVTAGGRVLGYFLVLYALGISSYFVASIASVLVGLDAQQGEAPAPPAQEEGESTQIVRGELEALRSELQSLRRLIEQSGKTTGQRPDLE